MNAKKYDFVLAPTTATPERAKTMLFSEGYMETDYRFLQKKRRQADHVARGPQGQDDHGQQGLGLRVPGADNAAKYGFKFDVYGTNADAVQAVLSGRADANFAGHTVSMWAAKRTRACSGRRSPTRPGSSGRWRSGSTIRPAAPTVNNAIKCMKQDGTMAKLYQKWFGEAPVADSWARTIAPGHGVPELPGYDAGPYAPKC